MIWTKDWAFMHNARCGGHNFKHRVSDQIEVSHPVYTKQSKYTRDQWIHQTIDYWKKEHHISDSITWITMVRNPYSRLVSWYFRRWKKILTFDQYIQLVTSQKTDNIMWMHITDKIGAHECRVFYFEDMPELEEYVGVSFSDTIMNSTSHGKNIEEFYNEDTKNAVKNAYAEEFRRFGYSTEPQDFNQKGT